MPYVLGDGMNPLWGALEAAYDVFQRPQAEIGHQAALEESVRLVDHIANFIWEMVFTFLGECLTKMRIPGLLLQTLSFVHGSLIWLMF